MKCIVFKVCSFLKILVTLKTEPNISNLILTTASKWNSRNFFIQKKPRDILQYLLSPIQVSLGKDDLMTFKFLVKVMCWFFFNQRRISSWTKKGNNDLSLPGRPEHHLHSHHKFWNHQHIIYKTYQESIHKYLWNKF